MSNPAHHIELWTHDLGAVEQSFEWLLPRLGWGSRHDQDWPEGRTWRHQSGAYIVLEQSPAVRDEAYDRLRSGLNHLALRVTTRAELDLLRVECTAHGWCELFGPEYPHAGGPDHTALFIENKHGFELELVVG